jgi:hypothetical protein
MKLYRFRRRSKSSRGTDRPRSTRILRAKPPPQIYAFIERGEIETVVIGRSRRGKTRSRQAAAPWAEGLRPIPSSQPENKNSPRQLESEAGLSSGIPRRFRGDSRRGGPPSIGEPCWTTTMCCLHNCVTPSFTKISRGCASCDDGTPRHVNPIAELRVEFPRAPPPRQLCFWEGSMRRAGSCCACARRRPLARPSFDLQKQRDEFALAMCVGLGKDRFQLIARRLP